MNRKLFLPPPSSPPSPPCRCRPRPCHRPRPLGGLVPDPPPGQPGAGPVQRLRRRDPDGSRRTSPPPRSTSTSRRPASTPTRPDRDKHLRSADFFDVEKFPEITFKSKSIAAAGKDKYNVTGTLTLHGVSKEVTLPVTYLGTVKDPWGGTRAGFEIETTLDRKDYGIVWNKAIDNGGVMLGDDVKIAINLERRQEGRQAGRQGEVRQADRLGSSRGRATGPFPFVD